MCFTNASVQPQYNKLNLHFQKIIIKFTNKLDDYGDDIARSFFYKYWGTFITFSWHCAKCSTGINLALD